jgi:hypothetical protein
VPDLDPEERREALSDLYSHAIHQGTRFPAAPYVVRLLIEACANHDVPGRFDLLRYWGSLTMGYFNIRIRPEWGDGKTIYMFGEAQPDDQDMDDLTAACRAGLHTVYRESLKGYTLACDLLAADDHTVRAGAAWVLACLPTKAKASLPKLKAQLHVEPDGWVRAGIAFAIGELGASAPLQRMVVKDESPAARCMAACELARIRPSEALVEPLLQFVSGPIEGYDSIPGAGGESIGDAAFSISQLPMDCFLRLSMELRQEVIPTLFDRLDETSIWDAEPLVLALLSAAFKPRKRRLTKLTPLQKQVLSRMAHTPKVWMLGDMYWRSREYGLEWNREKCAKLARVKIAPDEPLEALKMGLAHADIGCRGLGREQIFEALELDPNVFERATVPYLSWLLCAEAFADTDPERAIDAYRRAISINPAIARRVRSTWPLAALLKERGIH